MKIKTKFLVTVGVVAALLASLAALVDHQLGRYGTLNDTRAAAVRLAAYMLELRRHEKDFLSRKDPKYVVKFDEKHAVMDAEFPKLREQLETFAIDAADVESARKLVAGYAEQFKALAALQVEIGLDPKSGMYGRLRKAVHDVETLLKEHSNYELQVHMLMMRRAEKDFMLRRQTKYVEKFERQFAEMDGALSGAYLPDEERERIQTLLGAYRTEFQALVAAEKSIGLTHRDGRLGTLRETIHEVEGRLESTTGALIERVHEVETALKRTLYSAIAIISLLIAGALFWIGSTITRRVRVASGHMEEVALGDGDLTRRLDETGGDEIAEMAHSFNTFADKIHDVLKTAAERVSGMGSTGAQVGEAATATKEGMEALQSNTQAVVVATDELSATARDVADNAGRVADAAKQADNVAAEGRKTVEESVASINAFAGEFSQAAGTVASLRDEAENIGSILEVIRGIAEQTNLLALNAAIEAARAGEQGRGFAVVADEVRTLAHRSQSSTDEIQALIERLQTQAESAAAMIQEGHARVSETVGQSEKAGAALSRITESVNGITDMTTQIASAAAQQSAVVSDIGTNAVAIDDLAKDTVSHAKRTAGVTVEMADATAAVMREMQHFRFAKDEQIVLSNARSAHLAWRGRLQDFIAGKGQLTIEQAVSHHDCDLGKWYYGDGAARFGALPEFKAIESPHAEIHRLIKEVIKLKESGDSAGVDAAMKEVTALSGTIVDRIDALATALA